MISLIHICFEMQNAKLVKAESNVELLSAFFDRELWELWELWEFSEFKEIKEFKDCP